jgi:hypothetical protein
MSRHPIRTRAVIVGLVALAVNGALLLGVNAVDVEKWAQLAALVVTALASLGVITAESETTPTVDPRTDDGVPLVPSAQRRFDDGAV